MLRVSFNRSRQLTIALVLMYGAALACWLLLPLPIWARIAGFFLMVLSAAWSLAQHAWLATRYSVVGLYCDAGGGAQLEQRNGSVTEARVLGDSFVTPLLTVIHFKLPDGKRAHTLIVPDKALPEPYRQLRVWLKWRAGKGKAEDASGGWASRV